MIIRGLMKMMMIVLLVWAVFDLPAVAADSTRVRTGLERECALLGIVRQKAATGSLVRVAVVDDGFRLSHKALREFIYPNDREIPANYQDDDRNGYTDDLFGWDISEDDADVSVPAGREDFFYHGTFVAGIITAVFREYFGDEAPRFLRIIPVKALPDQARKPYLTDGYKGIDYAAKMGADIICCAWSGGQIRDDEKKILDDALAKGIMIIGAAGNLYSERTEPPSSYPGVCSVAALDRINHKTKYSNYGMRIDLSAPGDSVFGPHPQADNTFIHESGTSAAAAIITGCAAILKSLDPTVTPAGILDALCNTARPVDSLNLIWCGKLGAGIPDIRHASAYLLDPESRILVEVTNPTKTKGTIVYSRKKSPPEFEIRPAGAYKGIHLRVVTGDPGKKIRISSGELSVYDGPLGNLSRMAFFPGSRFRISLEQRNLPRSMELVYFMETIDSTTIFCRDLQYLGGQQGIIGDGSANNPYAPNCSCKWQITVAAGKRIRIEFTDLDTEPNIDFAWIFDGDGTLPENLLAKFSGSATPPVITTSGNQALIWFVTDSRDNRKGWRLNYAAVD